MRVCDLACVHGSNALSTVMLIIHTCMPSAYAYNSRERIREKFWPPTTCGPRTTSCSTYTSTTISSFKDRLDRFPFPVSLHSIAASLVERAYPQGVIMLSVVVFLPVYAIRIAVAVAVVKLCDQPRLFCCDIISLIGHTYHTLGYPGLLSSEDDFYLTSNGLVLTCTYTNACAHKHKQTHVHSYKFYLCGVVFVCLARSYSGLYWLFLGCDGDHKRNLQLVSL